MSDTSPGDFPLPGEGPARPAPHCDTCGDDGEVLTMVPGSTGEPVEGTVPCPDCADQRPRNNGIVHPAPDAVPADRVWAVIDEYFDLSVNSWDDGACPEPEDVWRLHRDLRSLIYRASATYVPGANGIEGL